MKKTMLFIGLIGVGMVLLAGGCGLVDFLEGLPTPDPEPEVIFSERFDDGQMDGRWEPRDGHNWAIAEEGDNYFFRSVLSTRNGAWTVDAVDLNDVVFDRDDVSVKFAVRVSSFSSNTSLAFVRLYSENHFYNLRMGPLNYAGETSRGLSFWNMNDLVEQAPDVEYNENQWYNFEINLRGEQITIYQDGAELISTTIAAPAVFDSIVFYSQHCAMDIDDIEVIKQ